MSYKQIVIQNNNFYLAYSEKINEQLGSGDATINTKSISSEAEKISDCKEILLSNRIHTNSSRKFNSKVNESDKSLENDLQLELKKIEDILDAKTLEKVKEIQRTPIRKRSLTLSDMASIIPKERTPKTEINLHSSEILEKIHGLKKQVILTKILSTLYCKLWRKKKQQNEELIKQVNQLMIQKSFLNNLREKESTRRDELTKISEQQKKDITEFSTEILRLREDRKVLTNSLQNYEIRFNELQLELEKTEYLRNKLHKENCEYVEHMHQIDQELIYLRSENKAQKEKILYMNNVADQQDLNLKQLHSIAEDLEVRLKEKIESVTAAKRRKDEAIENEKQAKYELTILEQKLKESTEREKKLRNDTSHFKYISSESEKQKIIVTLENVDLKYKIEELENKLLKSEIKIVRLEQINHVMQIPIWSRFKKNVQNFPWKELVFHFGIFFFPVISRTNTKIL